MKDIDRKVRDVQAEAMEGKKQWSDLALGYLRYEALRKLNAIDFDRLCQRNLAGENFDDMVDELVFAPLLEEMKAPYVGIIEGIGGWNACIFTWDEECKAHTPFNTGFNNTLGKGDKNGAIWEAKAWASDEEIAYKGPEPEEIKQRSCKRKLL